MRQLLQIWVGLVWGLRCVIKWEMVSSKAYGSCLEYYARLDNLCESEVWCFVVNEVIFLQRTQRSIMKTMSGVQFSDLMLMFDFNETIDQLVITKCLHWHGHVLRRMMVIGMVMC